MSLETAEVIREQMLDLGHEYVALSGFGEPTLHPEFENIVKIFNDSFALVLYTNGDCFIDGRLSIKDLVNMGVGPIIIDSYDGPEQTSQFIKLAEEFINCIEIRTHYDNYEIGYNNRGGLLGKEETPIKGKCFKPMYKGFIDFNGDVLLCCNDWGRKHPPFGNVHTSTLRNIVSSAEYIKVQELLAEGKREHLPVCAICDVKGEVSDRDTFIKMQRKRVDNKNIR